MRTYVKHHSRRRLNGSVTQTIWDMFLKRKLLVVSFIILLVILPIAIMTFQYTKNSQAAWFDDAWSYRKAIELPSHASNESNVYVTVPSFDATDSTKFQPDCGDLRFMKQNGEKLQYFVVSCNTTATIHVYFDSLPSGANTYYMYYGNPSAQNGFSAVDFTNAATGLGSQTLASEEQSQAPIAYWKFDEGQGLPKDSTSNAINTTTNTGTWAAEEQCISGKCLKFDNQQSTISNNPKFNLDNNVSYSVWFKITGTNANWPVIMGRNPHLSYALRRNQNDYRVFFEWGYGACAGSTYTSYNFGQITDRKWHFFSMTQDGTNMMLYLDGQLKTTVVLAAFCPDTSVFTFGNTMTGYIDEAKIYNYARTAAQIKADYNSKGSGSIKGTAVSMGTNAKNSDTLSNGLLAYWKSDEASGNGVDSSGNVNTTTVSGTNNYGTGKFGNGLRSGVATTNLEQNPSLETNLTGWGYWNNSGTATVTQSNEQARFGSYSYKQTVTSDGNQGVYSYGANITEGNTYTMSFWVNITTIGATESIPFYYRVWHSAGNYIIGTIATLTTTTNGWARYSMTQTIPTNGYTGNSLRLSFYTNKTGTTVYVDGVQIEQSSIVTPYADGSLGTGYSWSGTAHASTSVRTASAATNATLLNNTSGSLSFWFNSPSLDTSAQCPLGTSDGDNTGGLFFGLKNSGIYLTHQYTVGQTVTPQSVATISNNTWNHVAYTWDNTTRQGNLYVNGTLQQNVSYPQTITIGEYIQNLGTCTRTGYTPFNGILDDVRDYNRALTSAEVYKLFAWTPGPLAYYNFEEATGTTVNDSSGNGLNMTWVGSGNHYTSGKYGKSANLLTTSDYAYSTSNSLNMGTNDFTISTWIKTSNASRAYIIDKGAGDGLNGYRFETGTDFKLLSLIGGPSSFITATGNKVINDGIWHFVSVVFTRNGNVQIYVDGAPSGNPVDISALNGVNITNASNFAIGSNGGGAGVRYLGAIDDVHIYNYAQTSKQIVQDMNADHPIGGSPVGSQVGYWKFDEGFGTVANNSGYGGSILNGSIINASWTNEGKFSKTLNYDGTGDYTTVPNNAALNFGSNSFSVSYWLNFNPGSSQQRWTMGKGNPYQSSGAGWAIANWTTGNPITSTLYVSDGTGAPASHTVSFPSVSRGTWRQHTFVVDRDANLVKTYSNGVYYAQLDISSIGSFDSINDFLIGTGNGTTNTSDMKLDEVKIYNAALTADEVKLDYNRGSAMVLGTLSDTSALSGGSIASNSASAQYCVPGSSDSCLGPVAEWNFEEGQNSSTGDTSGNSNNGALNGGTTWVPGKIGKALSFNGANGYVDMGNGSSLNTPNSLTLSAWIKPKSNDGNWSSIISKSAKQAYFLMQRDTNKSITFGAYLSNGYKEVTINTADIALNEWQHITATYDGVNEKIYLNGILKATTLATGTINNISTNTLLIGSSTVASERFNGAIDQVRIYNYARTPAQISWDYNQGKPVGYWKLDECQGGVANDSSGNNNMGTITIGATGTNTSTGTCTSSGAWADGASGRFNSSLELDGTDDEITTADSPSLDMANMTVSAWIKTSNAAEQCIVERNNSTFYFCTSSGKLRYWINSVAATWTISNKSVNDNEWHHVLGTWDGTNKKLYIDGKLDITEAGSGGDISNTTVGLNIGVRKNAGVPQNYFNGQIDEVKLYNYAQTASQVKQQYNGGSAIRFGQF